MRGSSFTIFPGGKGANQAVALAKLGAQRGDRRRRRRRGSGPPLRRSALGARHRDARSGPHPGLSTGTASIEVTATGENHIIVVAGANDRVTPEYVESMREIIESCDWLLLQLEIPIESVIAAAGIAARAGVGVILDPAPARELPRELYPLVSIITPNETEAHLLDRRKHRDGRGDRAGRFGPAFARDRIGGHQGRLARRLSRDRGWMLESSGLPRKGRGYGRGRGLLQRGTRLALGEGASMRQAIRFANAVGALSTTREGAQSAMPSYEEAQALVESAKSGAEGS